MTTVSYPQYEEISLVNLLLFLAENIIIVIILMVRRLSDINNISLINIFSCLVCGRGQLPARLSDGGTIVILLAGPDHWLPHRHH